MFFGHYAVAVALKAAKPKIPALPLMLAAGWIDILDGLFIIFGWNRVTPNLHALPYLFFDLTFIDWDHSLLTALPWSLLFGAMMGGLFYHNKEVGIFAALCAFLHWIADWPMHNNDLALLPFSPIHFGWGLWGKLGVGAWLLEIVFSAILIVYAYSKSKKSCQTPPLWQSIFVAALALQMSPWTSPMKYIATLPEPTASLLHGTLVSIGFIIPSLILVWMYARQNHQVAWYQA